MIKTTPPAKTITISQREFDRLVEMQRTWFAVYEALHEHNPETFQQPGGISGVECAINEIKRLQAKDTK